MNIKWQVDKADSMLVILFLCKQYITYMLIFVVVVSYFTAKWKGYNQIILNHKKQEWIKSIKYLHFLNSAIS